VASWELLALPLSKTKFDRVVDFLDCVDVIPTSELRVLGVDIGELHSGDRQKMMNAGIRPQREHRTRAEAREKQTRQHKKHHYSVPILGNS
jgi:hypothetical protein